MRETAASSYLPIMQLVNQRPQALSRKRQSLRAADEALAAVRFDAVLFDALDATREDASRIAAPRSARELRRSTRQRVS
jgi:hypothetical protein